MVRILKSGRDLFRIMKLLCKDDRCPEENKIKCDFYSYSYNMSRLGSNMLLIVLVTICFVKSVQTQEYGGFQVGNSNQHKVDSGSWQFDRIKKDSENPRYGKCWTNAIKKVEIGCKKLTDDEQSRIALALTNCHLEMAGFTTSYPCSEDQPIISCLSPMLTDIAAFNAYTEFFTHSQDICFFLQSQVWQKNTEETVSKLAKSSEEVADQLEVASHLQSEMMEKQTASMKNQEDILKHEENLKEALKYSANSVRDIFDQMKTSTVQFEQIIFIQRLILGEFSWMQSFVVYVAAILIVYIATSTPRSAEARLWILGFVFLIWMAERTLFSWNESENKETIYQKVWLFRTIASIVAFFIFLGFYCYYKDYRLLNYKLLVEIHKKVHETAHEKDMSKQTLTSPHGEISVTDKGSKNNTSRSSSPSTLVGTMSATPSETEVTSERFTTTVCDCRSTCSMKRGRGACPCRALEKSCSSSCRCGTNSKPCKNRSESDQDSPSQEEIAAVTEES